MQLLHHQESSIRSEAPLLITPSDAAMARTAAGVHLC
jgi:hypothetical protein